MGEIFECNTIYQGVHEVVTSLGSCNFWWNDYGGDGTLRFPLNVSSNEPFMWLFEYKELVSRIIELCNEIYET